MTLHRTRPVALLAVAALLGTLGVFTAGARPAAAADFPATHSGYHTYYEMAREIKAVAAAHPEIVKLHPFAKSYLGRTIWIAKVSDNVETDEDEPEVMFDALHHGREHLTVEMTLGIFHWLVDGYGRDESVTRLVDTRETWIMFMVNPDGAQYDLTGRPSDPFRGWRKNRQPTPGSTSIGTDLNRNYGYRWGCCGGSSGIPSALTFRGREPWSTPEVRAVRDFVLSRVVGGRQQIRVAITWHAQGELILWPYGYTRKNIPSDMTVDDWRVFSTLGRQMAATNGYDPQQSSDLYVTDGDQIDWMYGTQRIFVYTFELYPTDRAVQGLKRFYPRSTVIRRETERNLPAVRRLMTVASCPWAVIGKQVQNCGAFFDDFEIARGWTVNAGGTDTATAGRWQRGDPKGTAASGDKQPEAVKSGSRAFVTGSAAGDAASANDLDGGTSTVLSPEITLRTGSGQKLTFNWVFAHDAAATAEDGFRVVLQTDAGDVPVLTVVGGPLERDGLWRSRSFSLDAWAGQVVRVRLEATDGGAENLVEALFDDVRVTRPD